MVQFVRYVAIVFFLYPAIPRRAIPNDPASTPACIMPQGRAKLPDPTLDLAKLKKVAILLQKRCATDGTAHVCVCMSVTWHNCMHVHCMSAIRISLFLTAHFTCRCTHPDPFLFSMVRMLIAPSLACTWCPLPNKGVTSPASLPLSTCLILLPDIRSTLHEWVVVGSHMT